MKPNPLVVLFLFLVSGAAFAQEPGCLIQAGGSDINFTAMTTSDLQRTDYGLVEITCAQGLAYTVEVQNAQPGGVLELVGMNPSHNLPVYLTDASNNQPLGQATYGEDSPNIGTGSAQTLSIKAVVSPSIMPAADTYQATGQLILLF